MYRLRRSLLLTLLVSVSFLLAGCDSFKGASENQEQKVQEAYISYFNAMIAGDIPSLKKHVSKEKVRELDTPDAANMLSLARGLYPAQSSVTGVTVTGDTAVITLTGQAQGGSVSGKVSLVKEDGLWKVSKEAWEMKMGFGDQPQAPQGGIRRPYEYERIVGTWKGKEAGHANEDWEFTFGQSYEVTATGPGGQRAYKGDARVVDSLGVEGNMIRVLPGGQIFDVQISDAPSTGYIGKLSLGSIKIEGGPGRVPDQILLCGGEPGLMKRNSDFASKEGVRCFELRRISGPPAGVQPVPQSQVQPSSQPSQRPSSGPSPFSKQDPGVTGEAIVVKDGKTETFPVRTGFFSDTRMARPTWATVQFEAAGPEHSNARKIEIMLDATKTGVHYADGKLLSDNFMSNNNLRIGERTPQGYTASFRWYNDGGQIFWPKPSCTINITSAYTGSPSSVFSGEVKDCPVHSAGIDYYISSVKFTMRGAPAR